MSGWLALRVGTPFRVAYSDCIGRALVVRELRLWHLQCENRITESRAASIIRNGLMTSDNAGFLSSWGLHDVLTHPAPPPG